MRKKGRHQGPRINQFIKLKECRLIGSQGEQLGVLSMENAQSLADRDNLDLVEVSPNANPPVIKIINYGKYKYDLQKKANIAKKKQVTIQLKEIQFRPNIEQHDLEIKFKKAKKFLTQGDKIKVVMQFRGREMAYRDAGLVKFKTIIKKIVDLGGTQESIPKIVGNRIITIVASTTKKV